jgi:hypothetical protein
VGDADDDRQSEADVLPEGEPEGEKVMLGEPESERVADGERVSVTDELCDGTALEEGLSVVEGQPDCDTEGDVVPVGVRRMDGEVEGEVDPVRDTLEQSVNDVVGEKVRVALVDRDSSGDALDEEQSEGEPLSEREAVGERVSVTDELEDAAPLEE